MPTIRTRETKQGTVYTIQVKVKNPVTGATVIKTTTWKPENGLTHKKRRRNAKNSPNCMNKALKNSTRPLAQIHSIEKLPSPPLLKNGLNAFKKIFPCTTTK